MSGEIIITRGKVSQINDNGLKLEGDKDWRNFTREEWRKAWYDASRGESIEIHETESNGKRWVKAIIPLEMNGSQVNNDIPFNEQAEALERDSEAPEQGSSVAGVSQHTKEIMAEIAVKLAVDCYIAGKIEWAQIMEATEFFTECQVSSAREAGK